MPILPVTVESALRGTADFLNSGRTRSWLSSKIENSRATGGGFCLDYILRIKVNPDGGIETRLLTQPNNEPMQLASWHGTS